MPAKRETIAKRIAQECRDGMIVNLGIGLPTLVPSFLPPDMNIWIQSENGILGLGPQPLPGQTDPLVTDAGATPVTIITGGCTFDSNLSFGLIRGGHVDITVLGAFEIDQQANLANWIVPGGKLAGMGGAMDLVTGAKKVIIATEHCSKDGRAKIKQRCSLPLTGAGVVDMIVTELAVFTFTQQGLQLQELAPGVELATVEEKTEAAFSVAPNLKTMAL